MEPRGRVLSLLEVRDAVVEFPAPGGRVRAVDRVSLSVRPGETVALVGESGSGKTTVARAVLGLQTLVSGSIELQGEPVRGVSRDLAARAGIVWQDPYASLDPRWTLERIVLEPLRLLRRAGDVGALLDEVGLDRQFAQRYPHQLSGGQRQRIAIARALAARPPIVLCDEPTAALDLSVQAQILNLLKDLQASHGCAYLYISHDLETVRYLADRVAVMYLGAIVEEGPAEEVFSNPRHPYTRALLASSPSIDRPGVLPEGAVGELPDPRTVWTSCRFASRCPKAAVRCAQQEPDTTEEGARRYRCYFPDSLLER